MTMLILASVWLAIMLFATVIIGSRLRDADSDY